MKLTKEQVSEAIAQAWCSGANSTKVMDVALASAIVDNIMALSALDEDKVLVPREPTEKMMDAGDAAISDGLTKAKLGIPYGLHPKHASWNVYKAMLDSLEKP